MFDYKIIFTGPTGSGKTTAILTYSDIEPVMTEVKASDETKDLKANTTVALDYGVVVLDKETKLHLYGTPGQARFEFMWGILSSGARGLILLLDHTDADPLKQLSFYLEKFSDLVKNVPVVIGVNKIDSPAPHQLKITDYEQLAQKMHSSAQIFGVDVRKEEDVRKMIMSLLFSIPKNIMNKNNSN